MPRTFAQIAGQADDLPAPAEQKGRISPRLKQVVALLTSGECKTVRAAAARVGLSESYLSHAWRKPHIQVFLALKCRETIASGQLRAASRLNELIDAESEHVSLDAVKHSLGIAGIKPTSDPQVSVSINLRAGYIIDLSGDGGDQRDRYVGPTIAARVASDP